MREEENVLKNNNEIENFAIFATVLLLASSIIRVGACLYLPAFPVIGKDLHISDSNMGLTISVYFAFFAIFSLISGPFSDAFGRRILILLGIIAYIVGSFLCGMANDFTLLLTGRIIQAIGASMIPGTTRAMTRDAGSDVQVVSLIGWIAVMGGVLLVGAPIIGGVVTDQFGWRYNFWGLVVFSVISLVIMFWSVPETLPHNKRFPLSLKPVLASYWEMLTSSGYMSAMIPVMLCFVFQGAYLASASFIFIRFFGLTPAKFGLSNIVIVIALTLGRYLSVIAVKKYSPKLGYTLGGTITFLAMISFSIITIFHVETLFTLLTAVSIFCVAFGVISPIGVKSSITTFRKRSGMAAALQGCLSLGATAVGSAITSLLMEHLSFLPTISIFSLFSIVIAGVTSLLAYIGRKNLV